MATALRANEFIRVKSNSEITTMKRSLIYTLVLVASATAAMAQAGKPDDSSLGTKAMKDQPGTSGGATAMPNAKPDDADKSISGKAMEDQPGTMGGNTDMPTAKPGDGSLGTKAMKDQPGTK